MTPLHDLVVGLTAAVIGCLLLLGAILDTTLLMSLPKVRLLAETFGKIAARWIIGAIGAAVIGMGLLIATGSRVGQVFNLP